MPCKFCGSDKTVKNGQTKYGKQLYRCNDCKHQFIDNGSFVGMRTKHDETAQKWLDGYVVNYNFVKPHIALKGKTPAQASGLDIKADWGDLIQGATKSMVKQEVESEKVIEVLVR